MTSMTVTGQDRPDAAPESDVELKVPADTAYVSVLRTTTAGLAARLDFTIDDIEDLRIAVGEACAMVLPEATPGSALWCRFGLGDGVMVVRVAVTTEAEAAIDRESFGWQVLTTLASEADCKVSPGSLEVRLVMRLGVSSLAGG